MAAANVEQCKFKYNLYMKNKAWGYWKNIFTKVSN